MSRWIVVIGIAAFLFARDARADAPSVNPAKSQSLELGLGVVGADVEYGVLAGPVVGGAFRIADSPAWVRVRGELLQALGDFERWEAALLIGAETRTCLPSGVACVGVLADIGVAHVRDPVSFDTDVAGSTQFGIAQADAFLELGRGAVAVQLRGGYRYEVALRDEVPDAPDPSDPGLHLGLSLMLRR